MVLLSAQQSPLKGRSFNTIDHKGRKGPAHAACRTLVAGGMFLSLRLSLISVLPPPLGRLIGEIPDVDLPLLKAHRRD